MPPIPRASRAARAPTGQTVEAFLAAFAEPLSHLARESAARASLPPAPAEDAAVLAAFPGNVAEVLFFREGEPAFSSWAALLRLATGQVAYLTASCDFLGFDCGGEIGLVVGASLASLLATSVSREDYESYRRGTRPL